MERVLAFSLFCGVFFLPGWAAGDVEFDQPGARAVAEAFRLEGIEADRVEWVECQTPPDSCGYRLGSGEAKLTAFSPESTSILVEEMMRNETVPRLADLRLNLTYLWMSQVECEALPDSTARACYFAKDGSPGLGNP